jgi:hypothetical protein
LAAVLRFQVRFYAYWTMITGKYPGELFGDKPTVPLDLSASPEGVVTPNPPMTESPVHVGTDESVANDWARESVTSSVGAVIDDSHAAVTPGAPTGPPLEFTTNESQSAGEDPPRTARLVLSKGSKRILVAFLILGVLGYSTELVLQNRVSNNQAALTRMATANNTLNSAIQSAHTQRTSCSLAANVCVQQYFSTVAKDLSDFQATLNSTSFPSGVQADAVQFKTATRQFVALLDQIKSGSSVSQAQLSQVQTLGTTWDTDFRQVISDLSSPI